MTLIRGYSQVDEDGKIAIPDHIRRHAGLSAGHLAEIEVVRIKGTSRKPHLVIHHRGHSPYTSPQEVIMRHEFIEVDEEGKIVMDDGIRSEANVDPGCLVEIKVYGSQGNPWIVLRNRGPRRVTTLQIRLGGKDPKKPWRTIPLDY